MRSRDCINYYFEFTLYSIHTACGLVHSTIILYGLYPLQVYSLGEASDSTPTVSFSVPRSEASGTVNNKKELYSFR